VKKPRRPRQNRGLRRLRILVLGDIHFRWPHRKALEWSLRYARSYRPNLVVQVGDLYDKYNWSRFPKSLSLCTPEEEETESRAMAEDYFGKLVQVTPGAERLITRATTTRAPTCAPWRKTLSPRTPLRRRCSGS
jgi:hypothetical protein